VEHEVRVSCDGVDLPLVPFVEALVGNTVAALIGSLKGAEGAREIQVLVSARQKG